MVVLWVRIALFILLSLLVLCSLNNPLTNSQLDLGEHYSVAGHSKGIDAKMAMYTFSKTCFST